MRERPLAFVVDGAEVEVAVLPEQTLLEVLRDRLGRTGVKYGCGEGVCGTCTVLLDGDPVSSCLLFARAAAGRTVTTVAGVVADPHGEALRAAIVTAGGVQCGFCTPGILVTAYHLLAGGGRPAAADIRRELAGNLCRCTGYTKIVEAIAGFAAGEDAAG